MKRKFFPLIDAVSKMKNTEWHEVFNTPFGHGHDTPEAANEEGLRVHLEKTDETGYMNRMYSGMVTELIIFDNNMEHNNTPDPEESDWQLTPARKAAIIKAADELKALLGRDPSPTYTETSRASEKIQSEIDTNRY